MIKPTARTVAFAQLHRSRVLTSLTLLATSGRAYGLDPLTGAVVTVAGERPPVHSSGAFHAYPWGLPDVPRS
jgi:hypothetical protein